MNDLDISSCYLWFVFTLIHVTLEGLRTRCVSQDQWSRHGHVDMFQVSLYVSIPGSVLVWSGELVIVLHYESLRTEKWRVAELSWRASTTLSTVSLLLSAALCLPAWPGLLYSNEWFYIHEWTDLAATWVPCSVEGIVSASTYQLTI